jgi:pimeloyl-ACP methyl ester carboxylesterase
MNPWNDASSWEGDGFRREVFFFDFGSDRLYASLYAASPLRLDARLVICTGWGHDLLQLNDLAHELALGVAEEGGAALLFHPPGHGDSSGSIDDITVQGVVAAALAAAAEGARLLGARPWDFAGIRIGASVAAMAAAEAGGRMLPLVLPALDLPAYFQELRRRAKRLSLGREGTPMLFGHPLPGAEQELPATSPMDVLASFGGRSAAIRYSNTPTEPLPEGVDEIVLPGRLSTPPGPREQARLAKAAAKWVISQCVVGASV